MRSQQKKNTHSVLTVSIALATSTLALRAAELYDSPYVPTALEKCAEAPKIEHLAKLAFDHNPFYLRGDFDGDRTPDYAVSARGPKSKRNGILFCMVNGTTLVIGADQPKQPPFSNMPDNNLVAPNWEVLSKSDQSELSRFTSNVPHPMPKTAGDAIGFVWEDGIGIIYWDGKRFRWSGPKE
jgi:hypothetical protein